MVPNRATHLKYKNVFILQLTWNFSRAIIHTLTFRSVHLQKESLFQKITQYIEFFMLLHDFIVTMMTSSSQFKQFFKGVDLNPSYAPVTCVIHD